MPNDIVLSNPLIEACYHPPSINQMRLLFACLMQIKAGEPIGPTRVFQLDAGGIADLVGGETQLNNYGHLKKAVDEMIKWTVTVDKKPNGLPGEPDRTTFSVVDSAEYYDGEGRIEISFGHHIGPHISDLKQFFTKVDPDHLFPLASGYAARLYTIFLETLLAAGEPQQVKEYTIAEFRRMFGLEKKYPAMRDLLRRVIRPAVDEINKQTDLRVRFGTRTGARGKIIGLQFDIERKRPAAAALPRKLTREQVTNAWNLYLNDRREPGESLADVSARVRADWGRLKQDESAVRRILDAR